MMLWFESSPDPAAARLADVAARIRSRPSAVPEFLRELYGEPSLDELFSAWWKQHMEPRLPPEHAEFISEVFRYDCMSRPIYDAPGSLDALTAGLPVVDVADEKFFVRSDLHFEHDVPAILGIFLREGIWNIRKAPARISIYCKVGFHKYYGNHEEGIYFAGVTANEIMSPQAVEPVE
jgi:radical SAM C-methyltransferase